MDPSYSRTVADRHKLQFSASFLAIFPLPASRASSGMHADQIRRQSAGLTSTIPLKVQRHTVFGQAKEMPQEEAVKPICF